MAIEKGYRQVMTTTDTEAVFDIKGTGLILITRVVGTWQLTLIAPDDQEIGLLVIDKPTQQGFQNAPEGTRLKLSGGTRANAWVGQAFNEAEGLLL